MKTVKFELTPEQQEIVGPLYVQMEADALDKKIGSILFQVFQDKPAEGSYVPWDKAVRILRILEEKS